MYTLFTHKEYGMPSIVSQQSKDYPVFIKEAIKKAEL